MPFDLGVDISFYEEAQPIEEGNIVHEGVRRSPQCREQLATFFQTGEIVDTCGDGGCVIDPDGLDIPDPD